MSEEKPGALAGNSTAASAGERDDSQRSAEPAAEKATSNTAKPEKKTVSDNTDGLSILALACSIAALVLTLFSVMPMLAWCFIPVGGVFAAIAFVSSIASIIRTTLNPKLEGRQQALAALGILSVYGLGVWVLANMLARHSG